MKPAAVRKAALAAAERGAAGRVMTSEEWKGDGWKARGVAGMVRRVDMTAPSGLHLSVVQTWTSPNLHGMVMPLLFKTEFLLCRKTAVERGSLTMKRQSRWPAQLHLITYCVCSSQAGWFELDVDKNCYDATDYAVLVTGLPPDAGFHEDSLALAVISSGKDSLAIAVISSGSILRPIAVCNWHLAAYDPGDLDEEMAMPASLHLLRELNDLIALGQAGLKRIIWCHASHLRA
eukprot:872589-Pelagomonas_calceolata.AAC.6